MELRELGDRLFRLHAKLIIAVFLVGILGGVAIFLRDQPQYQANVQFVLGAQDPQNAAEAAVLSDTAHGIATGPQLLGKAISEVGVSRNEAAVAAAINVQTIGSSAVLVLSVMDPNPRVAVGLANALAAGVVRTRVALTQSGLASSLRGLDRQEASTQAQIRKLNSQIGRLTRGVATPPQISGQSPVALELSALQGRLTTLQDQAAQIAIQRGNLQAQLGPKTTVIDKAVSAVAVPGRGTLDVLLGGLLGLVVGIAIAAVRETVRPSLVGAASISRAIGAPLLGEMNTPPDTWTVAALPDAGTYVELAADAQHVQDVRFAALESRGRHGAQVRMLEGPLHRLRFGQSPGGSPSAGKAHGGLSAERRPDGAVPASELDAKNSPRTGLVVAIPRILKLADVDALTNFIWISGWTLLGVMVHSPSKKRAITTLGRSRPTGSRQENSIGHVEVDA
jgi:capsular polysaccharide biosynthesis protein